MRYSSFYDNVAGAGAIVIMTISSPVYVRYLTPYNRDVHNDKYRKLSNVDYMLYEHLYQMFSELIVHTG